jgi:hypothetical protein
MSIGSLTPTTAILEESIAHVRGVLGVRVVQNDHEQIEEIHIIGSPERSAKQMVRDVESLLYVRNGLRIDHRKISLVQIATPKSTALPHVQLLNIVHLAPESTVTVTLAIGDRQLQGRSHATPTADGRPEYLAGDATIQALDQLIEPHNRLRLENVQCHMFGQIEICLAHLARISDAASIPLLGISVVSADGLTAAAQAVLNAVNQCLPCLLSKAPAF